MIEHFRYPHLAALGLVGCASVGTAAAADIQPVSVPEASGTATGNGSDFEVSIGPGVVFAPRYPGSHEFRVLPIPALDITYGRFFLNGQNGLGAYLYQDPVNRAQIGVSAYARFDRNEDDDEERLRGLGDIDAAPQARLFGSALIGPVIASGTLAHDFGGSDGTTVDLGASLPVIATDTVTLLLGSTIGIADDNFTQTFFGIDDEQARRGDRSTFDADAGIYQVGGNAVVNWKISERWSATGLASVDVLVGDAADSPVVAREVQPSGALFVSYKF